jgi:hypothetical protein
MSSAEPVAYMPNREARRGFTRQHKKYRMTFEGTVLDGLVATVNSVPVGTMLQIAEMAADGAEFTPEGLKTLGSLFELLADSLVEWNLQDDDGTPIPPTIDGVRTLDMDEALLLIREWMKAAAGVSSPLEPSLNGGEPSAVASLPMEPLSANPSSSPTPN